MTCLTRFCLSASDEAIFGGENATHVAGNLTGGGGGGGGGGGLFSDAEVEARFEYLTEGVILTIVSCVGLGRTELDPVVTLTELFL